MRYTLTPNIFHQIALCFVYYRWKLIGWSLLLFLLYLLLVQNFQENTPNTLVGIALTLLFIALQFLVCSAFIFFFQTLTSEKVSVRYWKRFYRAVEWCEAIIFTLLLPAPFIMFLYTLLIIVW